MLGPNRRAPPQTFRTEAGLVRSFVHCIKSGGKPFGPLQIAQEWNYESGFTDVLTCSADGALIAFEAKLKDWRKACLQGYRNTGFADYAYVVLPKEVALKVCVWEEYFARHQVGLCGFAGVTIDVLIQAPRSEPVMTWVRGRAAATFEEARNGFRRRVERDSRPDLCAAEC